MTKSSTTEEPDPNSETLAVRNLNSSEYKNYIYEPSISVTYLKG
jgi:hypothetical protein